MLRRQTKFFILTLLLISALTENDEFKLKQSLTNANSSIYYLQLSEDGHRMFAATSSQLYSYWNNDDEFVFSQHLLTTLFPILSLNIMKKHRMISINTEDGTMYVYKENKRRSSYNYKESFYFQTNDTITDVDLSPDHNHMLKAYDNGTVEYYRRTGSLYSLLDQTLLSQNQISSVSLANNLKYIVGVKYEGVYFYEIRSQSQLSFMSEIKYQGCEEVLVEISEGGENVIALNKKSGELHVYFWSQNENEYLLKETIFPSVEEINKVTISSNNEWILVCGSQIQIYRYSDPSYISIQIISEETPFSSCSIDKVGYYIAGSLQPTIKVYQLSKQPLVGTLMSWWILPISIFGFCWLFLFIGFCLISWKLHGKHKKANDMSTMGSGYPKPLMSENLGEQKNQVQEQNLQ